MSIKIMNLVWNIEENCLSMAEKMVLLKMADYSDDKGSKIYPSLETIAKKTCQTKRNVIRVIKSLQTKGYINVLSVGKYRGLSSTYMINLEILSCQKSDCMSPLMSDTQSPVRPPTGDIRSPLTGDTMSPQPPYTTTINTNYLSNNHISAAYAREVPPTSKRDCDSGLDRQIKEKEFRDEQPTKGQYHPEKPKKPREEPSRGLGLGMVPKPQKESVGLPKEHTEGKQLTAKGDKKMEPSIMEDKEDVLKMIEIWNETIKKDQVNALSLKPEFKENMMEAFESKFDNSFETWKEYCKYISLDEFFMGKKAGNNGFFTINLTWALKDESINTILLRIMDSKQSKDTPNDITPSKDFLISEALSSSEDEWLKRIKVVLIDYFYNARKHDGMKSYQSYLRGAKFEVSLVDGKKNLNVKTSFNAFNGLLPYHSLMAKAFQEFEKVTIFDGPSDRSGNSLYMERKSTNVAEPLHIWDRLCIEHGIKTIVAIGQELMEDSCKFAMGIR